MTSTGRVVIITGNRSQMTARFSRVASKAQPPPTTAQFLALDSPANRGPSHRARAADPVCDAAPSVPAHAGLSASTFPAGAGP